MKRKHTQDMSKYGLLESGAGNSNIKVKKKANDFIFEIAYRIAWLPFLKKGLLFSFRFGPIQYLGKHLLRRQITSL